MKQLTGSIPIAALPESTDVSAKEQLIATIEWLQKEGAASETNLKLLTAIVESILWSEESYTRFLQCGFDAAIELFDISSQNWEFEESMSSPHNPRNWDEYKRLAACTNIVINNPPVSRSIGENEDLKYSPR
jgi:phage/plasmid-associated DNA primase